MTRHRPVRAGFEPNSADSAHNPQSRVVGPIRAPCVSPLGEHRWLTLVSPEATDGPELVLEPDQHPAVRPFKEALVGDGIPFTSFAVGDVQSEFERLSGLGVTFTQPPTVMGPVTTAVLDDTCGNLIQIATEPESE